MSIAAPSYVHVLLVPYAAWVAFATVLNGSIFMLNQGAKWLRRGRLAAE